MASEGHSVTDSDLVRAAREVGKHPAALAMGGLVHAVLARQADGQTVFASPATIETCAKEHGLERGTADLYCGDLLSLLEGVPKESSARAALAALFVRGLASDLEAASDDEQHAVARRFAERASWLELTTAYVVFPLVDSILEVDQAKLVWRALGQLVFEEASGLGAATAKGRAAGAARLTALAASETTAAQEVLAALARGHHDRREGDDVIGAIEDGPIRSLAAALAGDTTLEEESPPLRGLVGRPARGGLLGIVRLFSGWALLTWLLRVLARLVGIRRSVELALVPGAVRITWRTILLGRAWRERTQVLPMTAIASAARGIRYPRIYLLVGVLMFAIGVVAGGLLTFEGVRSGETWLLVIAAAFALGGATLDLVLDLWIGGRRATVSLELGLVPRGAISLVAVPLTDADHLLTALERRLVKQTTARE